MAQVMPHRGVSLPQGGTTLREDLAPMRHNLLGEEERHSFSFSQDL
jgi:hypothetical protein